MATEKKHGLSTTAIVMIICTITIVICVAWVTWNMGWFHIKTKANISMGDYSVIKVGESAVEVSDDEVESSLESFLSAYPDEEEVSTGTLEEGDEVYISYVGTVDGEEFDGGSSDGTTLTLGSGSYIDGFEDGLIGAEIGSTVVLDLTFPDDYSEESLAGKDVSFTVDIQYKIVTTPSELTDEMVSEYSKEYFGEQIDTADALREFVYNYFYTNKLHTAMLEYLEELETVKSYDEDDYQMVYDYCMEELEYYASYYGYEADAMAALYGFDDADAYCIDTTEYYLNKTMLFDYLAKKAGFSYTDEDLDEAIQTYMDDYGYSDSYDVETFKETNGEAWLFLFKHLEFEYNNVLPLLEDRVEVVPDEELEDTTDESEEATSEDTVEESEEGEEGE